MKRYITHLLREGLLKESSLSQQEEMILNDLISETMDEAVDINTLISKFKGYAKQGAITAGILISLLSSDALAQEQKQELLNVAKSELSQEEISKMAKDVKIATGFEFHDSYVGDNFAKVEEDKPFDLPKSEEIKSLITKAGLPQRFIDNIYINHVDDKNGHGQSGVAVSIRLKEDEGFNRFVQKDIRTKVLKLIVKALNVYRPDTGEGIKNKNGESVIFNLEVLAPNGAAIGGNLQFK